MRLSTRNQLPGTITSIQEGEVTAIVKVALNGGGQLITSSPIGKVGGQWLTVNVTHPAYSLQHGGTRRGQVHERR